MCEPWVRQSKWVFSYWSRVIIRVKRNWRSDLRSAGKCLVCWHFSEVELGQSWFMFRENRVINLSLVPSLFHGDCLNWCILPYIIIIASVSWSKCAVCCCYNCTYSNKFILLKSSQLGSTFTYKVKFLLARWFKAKCVVFIQLTRTHCFIKSKNYFCHVTV